MWVNVTCGLIVMAIMMAQNSMAEPEGCDDDCSECCPCDGSLPSGDCRDSPYIPWGLFVGKWIGIVLGVCLFCCCVGVAIVVLRQRHGMPHRVPMIRDIP